MNSTFIQPIPYSHHRQPIPSPFMPNEDEELHREIKNIFSSTYPSTQDLEALIEWAKREPFTDSEPTTNQHDEVGSMAEFSNGVFGNVTKIEDPDLSNGVLRYIDEMLMDEDMDDKGHLLQASLDFQAKERSFYELLGQKYPYQHQHDLPTAASVGLIDPPVENRNVSSSSNKHNSFIGPPQTSYKHNESQVIWDFSKGAQVSSKPIPSPSKTLGVDASEEHESKEEEEETGKPSEPPTEELDDLWIYTLGGSEKEFTACITDLKNAEVAMEGNGKGKGRRDKKKRSDKKEVIDLISLLMSCAKCFAADDHVAATEFLRQIRRHSSPLGDGNQRLAHYFAEGLEARLDGTRTSIPRAFVYQRLATSDYLRVYCTSLMSSSFRKLSIFASNKLIEIRLKKATRVHIIDFGISCGFQWPPFIRRLAGREGGPPMLRITGVDFPQPGSRPEERIEETGCRLARYAKAFGVPFEYNAISRNWENIRVKDLKIVEGEFVAVNCLYRFKNLLDETVVPESSRSMVLDLINRINPDIFVHGIINGAYGVPFFLPRFREALYHFSALFDMNETILPRDRPERLLIEREILGNEATNVISCEGQERVERPETYKQWQGRHLKAGFVQLPIQRKLFGTIVNKVKNSYHREFVVVEDNKWLLMSWKGRTICALSCWKSV